MDLLEHQVLIKFTTAKKTLSLAESCTGGGLSYRLVTVPDASLYFLGSIVAYSNEAKRTLLQVSQETLDRHGAVSEQTALEMALGAQKAYNSDIAFSITGVAGPKTSGKPVGLVCFGLHTKKESLSWTLQFKGSREEIMSEAITWSLSKLLQTFS